MIATKQELKTNIGKLVWILPTGNNRPFRKSDEEVLYSSELLKVTLTYAYLLNGNTRKLRLDGNWDDHNGSGLIFLSEENALHYIWAKKFKRFLKQEANFSQLSYQDLKTIEKMLKESEDENV